MIEERGYRAAQFWRKFDAACRSEFEGSNEQYIRASLLTYFLVASQSPQGNYENIWSMDSIYFNRREFQELDRHAFHNWWMDSMFKLGESIMCPPARRPEFEINQKFLEQAMNVAEIIFEEPNLNIAYFFDYRFFQLASDAYLVDPRHTHLIAVLSNTIAVHTDNLIDAFPTTGELFATSGGERWRRRIHHQKFAVMKSPEALEFELRMRLALHGIGGLSLAENGFGDANFHPQAFIQIDTPPIKSARHSYSNRMPPFEADLKEITNGTELLWWLLEKGRLQEGLIVVSGAERTGQSWYALLRKELIYSGRLIAVLDLPKITGTKSRAARSVWVIGTPKQYAKNEILVANLGAFGHARSHFECGVIAEFAGKLVRCFQGEDYSSRWASLDMSAEKDQLRQIFKREFGNGYRDVPGLCRAISREEIMDKGINLSASIYFKQEKSLAFLSGIDGSPIVNELAHNERHGKSFYVIGNNGEGKSLLLRELAAFASRQGRKTVGISFGTTDRFPFGKRAEGFEQFSYEGARTSSETSSLRKTAADISNKLIEIHCAPKRLVAFTNALKLLNFDAKRFLVPLHPHLLDEMEYDGIIELIDDANRNSQAINARARPKMQAAFMRNRSNGGITPFSELSSGEQQMLALTIKFIASAEEKCLVLVDEPEISLHVRWQLLIPTLFRQLGEYFECDIVVATHSPLVISSTIKPDDLCFSAREQMLVPISERDQSSVESILFTGFGTHTENNRLVHERCAALVSEGIKIANHPSHMALKLDHLTSELAEIRRTVIAAEKQIPPHSLRANLELIRTTYDALAQIKSWNQGEVSMTDGRED